MDDKKTNKPDTTEKKLMVNIGVRVPAGVRQTLEEMASKDRRKLGELVRIKLEDIAKNYTEAA